MFRIESQKDLKNRESNNLSDTNHVHRHEKRVGCGWGDPNDWLKSKPILKKNGLFCFVNSCGEKIQRSWSYALQKMSGQTTQLRGINTQYENKSIV